MVDADELKRALAGIDRGSPSFIAVMAWAQDRLADARTKIDVLGLEPIKTEALRGRIAELRALVALSDPPKPPIEGGGTDYHR